MALWQNTRRLLRNTTPSDTLGIVDKSTKKTSQPRGKPFVKGDPRIQRGKGPAKGAPNAGRPPNEWNARMEALADRWLIAVEAGSVVDDDTHPLFDKVGRWIVEQLRGRAKQAVDVTSDGKALSGVVVLPSADANTR